MRYHKGGLSALASLPSHQFDKEGLLILRERHDSFFRRTEVSSERWCRLRGNLLFYLKTRDHWSEAAGVIVLEHCSVTVEGNAPHAFTILFGGGGGGQVCEAFSETDRDSWVATIRRCAPAALRAQLEGLQEALAQKKELLEERPTVVKTVPGASDGQLEVSLSCDNLPCLGPNLPPVACAVVQLMPRHCRVWRTCHTTEVIKSSNPDFLSTVVFGGDDSAAPGCGVDSSCRVRIVVRRVLDPLSHTSTIIGTAVTSVAVVRSSRGLRLSLMSLAGEAAGFVSLTCWRADVDVGSARDVPAALHTLQSTPTHTAHMCSSWRHRRTQSLPPRLSVKNKLSQPPPLCPFHANPTTATYRFHSGLGGDIAVVEVMAESILSLTLPQQLLKIWQGAERAWQEELEALGVLAEPWLSRQRALVAMHSSRSQLYEDATAALAACVAKGRYFKRSSDKENPQLEFAPINLHLQRVWGQNESLKRAGFHDVHTVGAFAANALGCGHGGLLTQLQDQSRRDRGEASSRADCSRAAVESTRRVRSALAASLNTLLSALHAGATEPLLEHLADVREKIDLLLSSLEASIVETAFDFLDQIKIPQSPSHLVTLASRNYSVHSNLSGYLSPESSLDKTIGQHLRKPDDDPENHGYTSVLMDRKRDTAVDKTPDVRLPHTPESEISYSNVGTSSYDHGGIVEAKYYCATDEPEPWDLIKLNLQASFICLSSKVTAIYNSQCQKQASGNSKNGVAPLAQIDGFSEMSAGSYDALTVQTHSADVSPTEDDSGIGLERNTPDSERKHNDAVKNANVDAIRLTVGAVHTIGLGKPYSTLNGIASSALDSREHSFTGSNYSSCGLETKSGVPNQHEQSTLSANGCAEERTSRSKLTSILETSKENILDGESISSPISRDFVENLSAPVSSVDDNSVKDSSFKETCGRVSSRYVDSDLSSVCDATGTLVKNLSTSEVNDTVDGAHLINASLPSLSAMSLESNDRSKFKDKRLPSPVDISKPGLLSAMTPVKYENIAASSRPSSSFCIESNAPLKPPSYVNVSDEVTAQSTTDNGCLTDAQTSEMLPQPSQEPTVALVVPSIIKLRGAVDGAVRTARLVHSLHKLQLPTDAVHKTHALQYRRDVCFSQALTTAVSGLVSCLWSRPADVTLLTVLQQLGPLLQFEGLLSCYSGDGARLSDMVVAVEDLATVQFVLVPASTDAGAPDSAPRIAVTGNRCGLRVLLPAPESLLSLLPEGGDGESVSFHVTPVFFNIGINEEATLAGKLRMEGPQHRNNLDSFRRLAEYHHRYAKLDLPSDTSRRGCWNSSQPALSELMERLSKAVRANKSKNTEVLHLAAAVTRAMGGVRFTSCKSGKDRTGMSVTLEQVNFLTAEFDLARPERQQSLQAMRSDGTRIINCQKNINVKKFAFNTMQLAMFPRDYAPPPGSYGASAT